VSLHEIFSLQEPSLKWVLLQHEKLKKVHIMWQQVSLNILIIKDLNNKDIILENHEGRYNMTTSYTSTFEDCQKIKTSAAEMGYTI